MILEGIVTTVDADGNVNVAPMGPRVDEGMKRFTLRPFRTSTTYQNLKHRGEGVLHVTDDVWLLAQAAIGRLESIPDTVRATKIDGRRLADCCRWYEFRVESIDDGQQRTEIAAEVVASGRVRDFFGLNRAKHAVVEAAILATRVGILPREEILAEMRRLIVLVEKTGGEAERRAFALLDDYVLAATRTKE
jgi:hypothetical protein